MEKYINKIEEIAKRARASHLLAARKIEEIRGRINAQTEGLQSGNRAIQKLTEDIQDLLIQTGVAIFRLQDQYLAELEKFYTIDGSQLTADAALLDGKLSLSQADVAGLSGKYRKNVTMHRMIESYALEHGLGVKPLPSLQSKVDLLDAYVRLVNPLFENAASPMTADDQTAMILFDIRKKQILEKIWD